MEKEEQELREVKKEKLADVILLLNCLIDIFS